MTNILRCFLFAAVILMLFFFHVSGCIAEEPDTALSVDVQMNGVPANIANFTLDELRAMPQIQLNYSSVTAYDAPSMVAAKGVALEIFLDEVGIDPSEVSMMILSSPDGGLLKYGGGRS